MYFNVVYNPLYDSTTARFSRYQGLQQRCLSNLDLTRGRRILFIGLGTGNEIVAAFRAAPHLSASGIDLSPSALSSSRRKLRAIARRADLQIMDATSLSYPDGCFDRVLCMHLLDFLDRPEDAVREFVRVLRPGGRFVATFPSRLEGAALGASLARDQVHTALRRGRPALAVVAELLVAFTMGLVYVPLLLRSSRRVFTHNAINALFNDLPVGRLSIEEERAYQDFVVGGEKR